jgi:DNA-binding NtrC family response regulator
MDCNILIVDPSEEIRDTFHSSFSSEGVAALIAEEAKLEKAVRYIETSNLHYMFLGPNLEPIEIKNFLKDTSVCKKLPVIVLLTKSNKGFEDELIKEGITSSLTYPLNSKDLVGSVRDAKEKFYQMNTQAKDETFTSERSIGTAHQLALVLSRLAIRLQDFSKYLKETPIETDINSESIPDAVTEVISKVSKLRTGKEKEDLQKLVDEITV